MTPEERRGSANRKIEWAHHHIRHLNTEIRSFLDAEPSPYGVCPERNPQTGQLVYYVTSLPGIPLEVSLIAGDACHGLRSALDHLAYQLWRSVANDTSGGGRHVNFPVFSSAEKYKTQRKTVVQMIGEDATKLIDALEPYKGGKGEPLWRLSELDNADKHRVLLTGGLYYKSFSPVPTIQALMRAQGAPSDLVQALSRIPNLLPRDRLFPLKVGDVLYVGPPEMEANPKMNFRFDIALNEAGIAEGQPIVEFLQQMAQFVGLVVDCFSPLIGGQRSPLCNVENDPAPPQPITCVSSHPLLYWAASP